MKPFSLDHFTRRLIAEALFYDEEYGALGSLSLVDAEAGKERYIASYMPDDGTFVIEEGLDTGPVLGVVTEPIRPNDTSGDLLATARAASTRVPDQFSRRAFICRAAPTKEVM